MLCWRERERGKERDWTGKGSLIEKKERKKKKKKKAKVPTLRYGGSFGSQETQAQAGACFSGKKIDGLLHLVSVECASRERERECAA